MGWGTGTVDGTVTKPDGSPAANIYVELHRATDLTFPASPQWTGPDGRRPFDLQEENPKLRDRYGRHPLGQYLLMARRLVESGVGFVSINGWCGFAPGEGSQGGPAPE